MTTDFQTMLAHLLDSADDAILVFNAEGEMVAANRLAREYCTGDPNSKLCNMHNGDSQLFDTLQDEPLAPEQYPHRRLLDHGSLKPTLLKIVRQSGKSRIINVTGEVTFDSNGSIAGCLVHMRDLGVRKHADEVESTQFFERDDHHSPSPSDLELESFIYSVSHDLQAPLRHILGFSGLLNEEFSRSLGKEGGAYISRIREACRKMQSQIFALLQLSRQTRGRMFWGSVNLSDIAAAVATELAKKSPERNVNVHIEKDLEVQGDQRLLIVLMEHLLDNAWKFTAPEKDASIEFTSSVAEGGVRVFHVIDNGVGFDVSRADKLFLPFRRYHGNQFEGSGVGLATALRVINRHNGKIWIDSLVDGGTTVHFTLG